MTATTPSPDTLRPPEQRFDPVEWVRKNLFDSWFSSILTVVSLAIVGWVVLAFGNWAFNVARWEVIPGNLKVFASGVYPADQLWRVWIVLGIVMAVLGMASSVWQGVLLAYVVGTALFFVLLALLGLLWQPLGPSSLYLAAVAIATLGGIAIGWKRNSLKPWTLAIWMLVLPVAFVILLGAPGTGLEPLKTAALSGLLLTLVLASTPAIVGFPIGILLALGRTNDKLPVVKVFCAVTIELFHGVPLTTLLFAAWLLVPYFLGGISIDLLIRAMVGFTLFAAVYIAEDVRGGLQGVARGQLEAARALGLNPFQLTMLVTLPQALRTAIPALVNEFLTLFKDTSLVFIISLTELLRAGRVIFTNPEWLGTQKEVLVFVGLVYFVFCYAMAYAAKRVEKSLGIGER
jgi:general L-amino acid transport system permease protein